MLVVNLVMVLVLKKEQVLKRVVLVMVMAKYKCAKAYLLYSKLVLLVVVKVRLFLDPCPSCRGQGRVEKTKTLSVKIPAGVDTGDRIRLSGEGEAGEHGAPAGDLYVQVNVRDHDIFVRDENHLYCEVPISFVTAALGGEIEVPTLGGKVKLKVPKETQTGKMFRLRGKGVKSVRSSITGDLMCKVVLETPINLSGDQADLLRQLEEKMGKSSKKHSPKETGFFDGVKKFFDDLKS